MNLTKKEKKKDIQLFLDRFSSEEYQFHLVNEEIIIGSIDELFIVNKENIIFVIKNHESKMYLPFKEIVYWKKKA